LTARGPITSASTPTPPLPPTSERRASGDGGRVRFPGSGDAGAMGVWTIVVNTATPNQFTLIGSVADGGGGAGGTAQNLQGILHGRQAFPNLTIAADPSNANLVYIAGDRQDFLGGASLIRANAFCVRIFPGDASVPAQGGGSVVTDAIHQWTPLTHSGTSNGSSPHADSRAMVIDAGTLVYACDGGIFNENNPTTTTGRWFSDNGAPSGGNFGIQVTQFSSDISYDSLNDIIFGGAQDTGTPQQSASQSRVYNDQTQGDGPFTYSDNLTNANQSIRYIGFGRNIWDNTNTDIGPDINLIPAG